MPCDSSHCAPTGREIESAKVLTYLQEVGLRRDVNKVYGNIRTLDHDTALLCKGSRYYQVLARAADLVARSPEG